MKGLTCQLRGADCWSGAKGSCVGWCALLGGHLVRSLGRNLYRSTRQQEPRDTLDAAPCGVADTSG